MRGKSYLIKYFFVFIISILSFSCDDDDNDLTQDEMLKELTENGSDKIRNGLLSNVKQVDLIYYIGAEWVDGKVEKGEPLDKVVSVYDSKGFITEFREYAYDGVNFNINYLATALTFDGKGRYLTTEGFWIPRFPKTDTTFYRSEVSYDDASGRATILYLTSKNKIDYSGIEKRVISLYPNGHIQSFEDASYYAVYNFGLKSGSAETEDKVQSITERIEEKDPMGNWIVKYEKLTDKEGLVKITGYYEREISYF